MSLCEAADQPHSSSLLRIEEEPSPVGRGCLYSGLLLYIVEGACITLIAGYVEGEEPSLERELGAQEEEEIVTRGKTETQHPGE